MYDKVKLWIARNSATPDISKSLDGAKDVIVHKTGEICTFGYIEGLKVSIYTGGISIVGSLAKHLYPNNIYPLDRHTTAQAIEKLSDCLHINLDDTKVTGLEFGTQFVMTQPVKSYLSKLGDMPKLLRYHFNAETLYYIPRGKQQLKVFTFYDKNAEAEAKGMAIPIGFEEANLLKYEMRLNGRLPQQLGVPEVVASTLSEKAFYQLMVKRYQESYFSISKLKPIKPNIMGSIKTVSDAFDVLVALLINQSDKSVIAAFLEELKEDKVFKDRKYLSRLKKKIEDISAKVVLDTSNELIKELDDEIRNIGAYI